MNSFATARRRVLMALVLPTAVSAQALTADQLQPIQSCMLGPGLVTGRLADIEIDPRNTSTGTSRRRSAACGRP